jgi:hypothetical protein
MLFCYYYIKGAKKPLKQGVFAGTKNVPEASPCNRKKHFTTQEKKP